MKNKYEIRGEITAIFIKSNGLVYESLVDTSDLERVKEFKNTWFLKRTRTTNYVHGKTYINGKLKTIGLHRWIMSSEDHMQVDHINHDGTDNRRSVNLRDATAFQNMQNMKLDASSKSGIRGVYWNDKNKKWYVRIEFDGKLKYIGSYSDLENAKDALMIARARHMPFSQEAMVGELFERNFPKEHTAPKHNSSGHRNVTKRTGTNLWVVYIKQKYYGSSRDLDLAIKIAENARIK